LMMIGAVVNSIIVSSMISVLADVDEASLAFRGKKQLIEAFAHHTKLDSGTLGQLKSWLHSRHKETSGFDSESMRKLLVNGGGIPRELLGILPGALFEGAVVQNRFMQVCLSANARGVLPPRFTLLLALELTEHRYKHHEIVYHAHDHAFNLFLVTQGTFAHVARPTQAGGEAEVLKAPPTPRTPRTVSPSPPSCPSKKTVSILDLAFGNISVASTSVATARFCCLPSTNRLHPFQLFSSGAYCGDIELFSGKTRHSSWRNETTDQNDDPCDGVTLVMSKSKLDDICNEFPQYKAIWEGEAKQRERHRERLLSRLTQGRPYKELAVTSIQKHVRQYLQQKRRSQSAPSLDGTAHLSFEESNDSLKSTPQKSSMLVLRNQLRAATASVPIGATGAPKPGSETSDLGALREQVQAHGKQLEQALEGINQLLEHRKHGNSTSSDAQSFVQKDVL